MILNFKEFDVFVVNSKPLIIPMCQFSGFYQAALTSQLMQWPLIQCKLPLFSISCYYAKYRAL